MKNSSFCLCSKEKFTLFVKGSHIPAYITTLSICDGLTCAVFGLVTLPWTNDGNKIDGYKIDSSIQLKWVVRFFQFFLQKFPAAKHNTTVQEPWASRFLSKFTVIDCLSGWRFKQGMFAFWLRCSLNFCKYFAWLVLFGWLFSLLFQ